MNNISDYSTWITVLNQVLASRSPREAACPMGKKPSYRKILTYLQLYHFPPLVQSKLPSAQFCGTKKSDRLLDTYVWQSCELRICHFLITKELISQKDSTQNPLATAMVSQYKDSLSKQERKSLKSLVPWKLNN